MVIDKAIPIPLYFQLAEHLREQIELGQLKPGHQLPSERELSEQSGISRMTARQAILYLVRQGRLVVRPGIGTFVAEPKLTHDTLHLLGFTEEMLRNGLAPSSQVLEQALAAPPPRVAARLNLQPDDAAVKIVRLRLSQDTPLLLETVFVPQRLAPGLEHEDLSQASLYTLLEEQFGLPLEHAYARQRYGRQHYSRPYDQRADRGADNGRAHGGRRASAGKFLDTRWLGRFL